MKKLLLPCVIASLIASFSTWADDAAVLKSQQAFYHGRGGESRWDSLV
jgi:hypothetical protein